MGAVELTGKRFGSWTVLGRAPKKPHYNEAYWLVRCDCGYERAIGRTGLRSGRSTSCGCAERPSRQLRLTHDGETLTFRQWSARTGLTIATIKHRHYKWPDDPAKILSQEPHGRLASGISRSREYRLWQGMWRRCTKPNRLSGHRYFGRGIQVCEGWKSFERFIRDMGAPTTPKHEIDRIDNDGGYWCGKCDECVAEQRPANCRWATHSEQMNNTSRNVHLTLGDVTLTQAQWAKKLGLGRGAIPHRLRAGYPIEQVLSPERLPRRRNKKQNALSA